MKTIEIFNKQIIMNIKNFLFASLLMLFIFPCVEVRSQEPVYWDVVQQIMNEAFNNSQVMENASWITDVFGPRNAGSDAFLEAADWAKNRLEEYGLSNVCLDPFEFGTGWECEYTSVHMMKPRYMPVIAYAPMWSDETNGKQTGKGFYMNFSEIRTREGLLKYKGKLKNKVIFCKPEQEMQPALTTLPLTYTEDELDELARIKISEPEEKDRYGRKSHERLPEQEIIDFVFEEGAIAIAKPDGRESFGTVVVNEVTGKPWEKDAPKPPTEIIMANEHYNRMIRIMDKGIPVELEVEIRTKYYPNRTQGVNVIGEIPGTDLADEVVIIGGHLDANPAGTGAMDNAASVVAAMEAMRILKKIGVKPRRTIRVAFWGVHELGTFGSRSYAAENYGDVETQEYLPAHARFSAYYDTDIGPGKIRGVYIQNNDAVRPIFTEWMKPLHGLGMKHLVGGPFKMEGDGFNNLGLPGFQFVQDRKEMDDRIAHTNMDVYERLIPEGLMQSAVVFATFAYHTAMRDELLPRVTVKPKDKE